MFGKVISTDEARELAAGSRLLSFQHVTGGTPPERTLLIPLQHPEKNWVVVGENGTVGAQTSLWRDATYWDVTHESVLEVDPAQYAIGRTAEPNLGEIAYTAAGEWLLGVKFPGAPWVYWVNISTGTIIESVGSGFHAVRFPSWRLSHPTASGSKVLFEMRIPPPTA